MVLALDKKKIARCFRRSMASYDTAAVVQNDLAGRLMRSVEQLPDTAFRRVFEVGCCTGVLTEMLCRKRTVHTLFLNDLVAEFEEPLLRRLAGFPSLEIIPAFGDIESLELPQDLSLVLSGATFQWLSDLPAFLNKLAVTLQSGAYLAFSLFGPGTLKEFSSISSVELHYYPVREILSFLEKAFVEESRDSFRDTLFFPAVRDVLNHVRATGVGGVSQYQWTRESLRSFEEQYEKAFRTEKGLPVTYVSSTFVFRRR